MTMLKKALAAITSFVLAFALMVPAVSWAANEELAVRVNYNGKYITLSELPEVPHTLSITFKPIVEYEGFAGVNKQIDFRLVDTQASKKLRVCQMTKNDQGYYTVVLSNGNEALPMLDGTFLDIGSLTIMIDATLDLKNGATAQAMRKARLEVTDLQISNASFTTTNIVGGSAEKNTDSSSFTLTTASFSNTVGRENVGAEDGQFVWPIFTTPDTIIEVQEGAEGNNGAEIGGVEGPGPDDVSAAMNETATAVLNTIWDGKEVNTLSKEDYDQLKAWVDRAKAAGIALDQVVVKASVEIKKYDNFDSLAADDKKVMDQLYDNTYSKLGFYDLKAMLAYSCDDDKDLGNVQVRPTVVDKAMPFTVTVEQNSLEGKTAYVGYVHDGKGKTIEEGITANKEANTVTFSAKEFSTYGVYAKDTPKTDNAKTATGANKQDQGTQQQDAPDMLVFIIGGIIVVLGVAFAIIARKYMLANRED